LREEVTMTGRWNPPIALDKEEEFIISRLKRTGKLFAFLRRYRHELFDDEFRAELEQMYSDMPRGTPSKDPALLAMVTVLQAYEQASDATAVENALLDRRWQMVLGTLEAKKPVYSQGVLVDFRRRLIEHDMDRRLLERTVELARRTGGFGHKALRVALDSAPLAGAGRVEDTFNLIGHAMEIVVECTAVATELTPAEVRTRSGVRLLGKSSVKAALDVDWDNPVEQQEALRRLLDDVAILRSWIEYYAPNAEKDLPLKKALDLLERVISQDIEPDPEGGGSRIRQGTAKDRIISVTDPEMRHGRKSKSRVINGYKRHIATELDEGLILATTVRPANEHEYAAESEIRPDVERLGTVVELHIDRGYLSGGWVRDLYESGVPVLSKAWDRTGERYGKADFRFEFDEMTATCPGEQKTPLRPDKNTGGMQASFSVLHCRNCPLRLECIPKTSARGKALRLHPMEPLLQSLRDMKQTPLGRTALRERVEVEHHLAHVTQRQGPRARYIGVRKNVLDLRRIAVVENLHVIQRAVAA
jgi:IS5 family transposase